MSIRRLRFVFAAACLAACLPALGSPQGSAKLQITDIIVGKGHKAAPGDMVTVQYEGKLANGTVFDSNTTSDVDPFVFHLGKGEVIKGWDEGVVGMCVKGKRTLVIPPELGYGSRAQAKIPANSTLYFTITVLDIVPVGEESYFDKVDLVKGKGAEAVAGSTVTVDYIGTLVNGKKFDSTYDTKKPVTFTIGAGEAIKAVDLGIRGMRVGGKRRLRLPPAIAFGLSGNLARGIPSNAVVIYTIELKKVGRAKS